MRAPAFETLNVSQPEFFKSAAVELPKVTMDTWRAYFEYHLCARAPRSCRRHSKKENFDFWQRYLTGAQEQRPRQFRCVRVVDRELGDLLGQKYISSRLRRATPRRRSRNW